MLGDIAGFLGVLVLLAFVIALFVALWVVYNYAKVHVTKWKNGKVAALLLLVLTTGCTRIEPGNVGISIANFGDDRGVQNYVLRTGIVAYAPFFQSVFEYPTYTQTVKYEGPEALNFNSKEGTVFTAAMSVSYSLTPEKVPAFYVKFRNDDLRAFTHSFFRNVVRSSLNNVAEKYTAEEVYSLKKEEIVTEALKRINQEVGEYGVVVEQFGFLSAPEPPRQIIEAINAKTTAIQTAIQVENELRTSTAQAQKIIAAAKGEAEAMVTRAKGEAEANNRLSASLTPLLVQAKAIEKWNGQQPQVMSGQNGLLFNIGQK